MTQGDKEPFTSFLPKFEKELADANGAGWTSAVKISYLKKTLNGEMRRELKGQLNMPQEYNQYVRALHDLGANLDEFRAFSQRHSSWRPAQKEVQARVKSPSIQAADAMDWEPTKVSRTMQKENKNLKGKRAKWVSQEELDRRREEYRCLRCGRSGCRIAQCPLLPAKRPTPMPNAGQSHVKRSKPVTKL